MGVFGTLLLEFNSTSLFCVLWILLCMVIYAALSLIFPKTRKILVRYLRYLP